MITGKRHAWHVAYVVVLGALTTASALAADKPDAFRTMMEERAATAIKDNNVQAMIECAFALYPIEVAAKVESPKHADLIKKAAAVVLAKNDAKEATAFLETAGPLLNGLKRETRDKLAELATGKTASDATKEAVEKSRAIVLKVGADLINPEIKVRGDDLSGMAREIGSSMISAAHPSAAGIRLGRASFTGTTLIIRMDWKGGIIATPYSSNIELTMEKRGGRLQVTDWDYEDDCVVPPNLQSVRAYLAELNRSLK